MTVEHPFGTIKSWMGNTHFKMPRLKNVATEMPLHVLDYNLTQVMNIIGIPALLKERPPSVDPRLALGSNLCPLLFSGLKTFFYC